MRRKLFLGVSSVLVLSALLVTPIFLAGPAAEAAGPKTLKIGTVAPISGPLGVIGLTWDRGFDLTADWLNEQGGLKVGGDTYRIEFIHEDGKASPEASAAAANKLVYQDKVQFVIGAILNPSSQAIYSVTNPAGALHVLMYSMDPYRKDQWGLGPDNPLLVLLMPTINLSFKPFFEYFAEAYPNVKRLVHAEPNYPFGAMVEEAVDAAKAKGFEVVGGEVLDYGWTDFYPFMTSVLSQKPEGIFIIHGGGPDLVAIEIKAARQLGFKGPIISFGSASPALVVRAAGTENSYDMVFNQAYAGAPEATKMMKEVKKRWEAKYPKELWIDDALMAWDEVWVLAQAIEKAQSLDPPVVQKTLEGMSAPGSLKTTFGPGHMGGSKTLGVNRMLVRPFPVTVLQGKEMRMVKWVTPELP